MNRSNKQFKRYTLFILLLLTTLLGTAQVAGFNNREAGASIYPGWFDHKPFTSLADNLDQAEREGKLGVMVLFSTAECTYCDEFIRSSLSNPAVAATVQKHFRAVGMEIFADPHTMNDASGTVRYSSEFARQESSGYSPTIVFYGSDGKRILRLVGYQSPERFRRILDNITGKL